MASACGEVHSVGMVMVAPDYSTQMGKLIKQNAYLACTVTKKMLNAEGLNGLHYKEGRFTHEVINESGFKGAVETLEKSCMYLRNEKQLEMERLVSTLDITDSQLCSNFQRVSEHLMQDDVRFGRIGSLFFFTFVLCKRLHQEGRQREVDSVIDWLASFLNEKVAPWLIKNHRGEWVSLDVVNIVLSCRPPHMHTPLQEL